MQLYFSQTSILFSFVILSCLSRIDLIFTKLRLLRSRLLDISKGKKGERIALALALALAFVQRFVREFGKFWLHRRSVPWTCAKYMSAKIYAVRPDVVFSHVTSGKSARKATRYFPKLLFRWIFKNPRAHSRPRAHARYAYNISFQKFGGLDEL